mgnify:CR=1 FL=1
MDAAQERLAQLSRTQQALLAKIQKSLVHSSGYSLTLTDVVGQMKRDFCKLMAQQAASGGKKKALGDGAMAALSDELHAQVGVSVFGALSWAFGGINTITFGFTLFALVALEAGNDRLLRMYTTFVTAMWIMDVVWLSLWGTHLSK